MMDLPAFNASMNGLATVFLTVGIICIKLGHKNLHRGFMAAALSASVVFLVGYVGNRVVAGTAHTPFAGPGFWKGVYYPMLASHILLAIVIVPLVLRTLWLAVRGEFERHRAWARWTFPLWYYVSVTGVLVYFFLYQWFPAS